MAKNHDKAGQFKEGNQAAKGHGRPRKPAPEYLAAVADELSLDSWRKIIGKAIEAAIDGDHRARSWITTMFLDAEKMAAEIRSSDLVETMSSAFSASREAEPTPYLDQEIAEREAKRKK